MGAEAGPGRWVAGSQTGPRLSSGSAPLSPFLKFTDDAASIGFSRMASVSLRRHVAAHDGHFSNSDGIFLGDKMWG